MTKLFKSINISLVAAIIMILVTALNLAEEITLTEIMPGGGAGGNDVRGIRGVIGAPTDGWAGGTNWQTYNPGDHWLVVGQGLSVGFSEPTNTFSVNGTARVGGTSRFEQFLDVAGNVSIQQNLRVTGNLTAGANIGTGDIDAGNYIHVGALYATNSETEGVNVNGEIWLGATMIHPPADYVFEPDYKLESIEEHAEVMWEKKRLPAVPLPEKTDGGQYRTEIGGQQRGILEELEKAHIYITQLKEMLDEQGERVTNLENKKLNRQK